MNMNTLLEAAILERIALTLVHFLWQGAALWGVGILGLLLLRRGAARWRYLWLCAVLFVMALAPVATFALLGAREAGPAQADTDELIQAAAPTVVPATPFVAAPGQMGPPATAPAPPAAEEASQWEAAEAAFDAALEAPPLPEVHPSPAEFPEAAARAEAHDAEASQASSSILSIASMGSIEAPPPPAQHPQPLLPAAPLAPYAPYLVLAYALGVLLMWARLAVAVHGGYRLRRSAEPVEDAALLAALARQAAALGMRAAPALAMCERVVVPTVVGILKPMVLLPAGLCAGLTPAQLELLLCHELAHIRRYDPIVNLAQGMIEALLFFHPAVLHLSRRLRLEREHCCDALVIAAGGPPMGYAESLLRAAEQSHGRVRMAALLLQAAGKPSHLSQRIHRILDVPGPRLRLSRGGMLAITAAFLLGVVAVLQVNAVAPEPEAEAVAAADLADESGRSDRSDRSEQSPAQEVQADAEPAEDDAWDDIWAEFYPQASPWLRKVTLQRIGETGDNRHVPLLINVLQQIFRTTTPLTDDESLAAAEALGKLGDPEAIPPLVAALGDFSKPEIAAPLGQFPPEQVMPLLEFALREDPGTTMYQNALHVLGHLGTRESVQRLLEEAAARRILATDGIPDLHEPFRGALRHVPPGLLREVSTELLARQDEYERMAAAISLLALGGETPPQALLEMTQDPDAQLRRVAVAALGGFTAPEINEMLVTVLTTDPTHELRGAAAAALQERGFAPADVETEAAYLVATGNFDVAGTLREAAVEPLQVALRASEPGVRGEAAAAYARVAPREAYEPLLPLLRDSSSERVQIAALEALQHMGNPDAIPAVAELLKANAANVRQFAAYVLGHIGDARAVAPLLASVADPEVQRAALEALVRLDVLQAQLALVEAMRDPGLPLPSGISRESFRRMPSLELAGALEAAAEDLSQGNPAARERAEILRSLASDVRGALPEDTTAHETPPEPAETQPQPEPAEEERHYEAQIRHQFEYDWGDREVEVFLIDRSGRTTAVVRLEPDAAAERKAGTPLLIPISYIDRASVQIVENGRITALYALEQGRIAGPQTLSPPPISTDILFQLQDSDWWVRKLAYEKVAKSEYNDATSLLIDGLKDEHQAVRLTAVEALGARQAPEALVHLVALLKDSHPQVRQRVAEVVAQFPAEQALPLLLRALEDAQHREAAVDALIHLDTPEARAAAIEALVAGDLFQRWTGAPPSLTRPTPAFEKLRLLPEAEVVPRLAAALEAEDVNMVFGAALALQTIGTDAARAALIEAASGGGELARIAAVEMLDQPEDVPMLIELLHDADPRVRRMAARGLDQHVYRPETPEAMARFHAAAGRWNQVLQAGEAAVDVLVDAAAQEYPPMPIPHWQQERAGRPVQFVDFAQLASALGRTGSPRAVPGLEGLLAQAGAGAVQALNAIPGPEADAALARALKHPNVQIRYAAAGALVERKAPVTLPELAGALRDPDHNVRMAAAYALRELGTEEAAPALLDAARDVDANVHSAAVIALRVSGTEGPALLAAHYRQLPASARYAALMSEGGVPPPTPEIMVQGLHDENPEVQETAFQALRELDEETLATFRAWRDSEQEAHAAAYGELVAALLEMLEAPELDQRIVAANMLAKLEDPALLEPLEAWLDEESARMAEVRRAPRPARPYTGINLDDIRTMLEKLRLAQ